MGLVLRFNKGVLLTPVSNVMFGLEVSVLGYAEYHVVIAVTELEASFTAHLLELLSAATTEMVATMPVIYLSELAKDKDAIGIFRLECVSYAFHKLRPQFFKAF